MGADGPFTSVLSSLKLLRTDAPLVQPANRASYKVIEAGREFVSRYGEDELRQVAKFHFATTECILDSGLVDNENL